jgi:hypothetical protein
MKKILEIPYLLWNVLIVIWNISFIIRHYPKFDVEVISAMIISAIFIFLIYRFFTNINRLNSSVYDRTILKHFLIGILVLLIDIFIVFCVKFKGLSFG